MYQLINPLYYYYFKAFRLGIMPILNQLLQVDGTDHETESCANHTLLILGLFTDSGSLLILLYVLYYSVTNFFFLRNRRLRRKITRRYPL